MSRAAPPLPRLSLRLPGSRALLLLALGAGFGGAAFADTAAIERCRKEPDSLLRLRCYDAIPLPAAGAPAAPPAPAARGAAAPAAAAAGAAPAAAAAAPASPATQFGLENRPQPQQPKPVDSIESSIPGRVDGWVANTRFRLANGQVWEIRDGSRATYDLRDPKVRIVRGLSGSFFMELEGVSQSPRVRRVE
jgi:hypothetical protein